MKKTEEHKQKIRQSLLGKKPNKKAFSPEAIKKRVETRKKRGWWKNPEKTRKKISDSMGKQRLTWDGYRRINVKSKRILEHIYIWLRDSDWGFIPKGFIVHHIDGNKLNNVINNLVCIPRAIHAKIHIKEGDEFWTKRHS